MSIDLIKINEGFVVPSMMKLNYLRLLAPSGT